MNDDLDRAASEITRRVDAALNAELLKRVAHIVADAVQEHRTPELEILRETLQREGLKVPFLGCEGFTRHWEECTQLKYHAGDCT